MIIYQVAVIVYISGVDIQKAHGGDTQTADCNTTGHYVTYVRSVGDTWLHCDDERIEITAGFDEVQDKSAQTCRALVYTRVVSTHCVANIPYPRSVCKLVRAP